jgi:hypothetical protein
MDEAAPQSDIDRNVIRDFNRSAAIVEKLLV